MEYSPQRSARPVANGIIPINPQDPIAPTMTNPKRNDPPRIRARLSKPPTFAFTEFSYIVRRMIDARSLFEKNQLPKFYFCVAELSDSSPSDKKERNPELPIIRLRPEHPQLVRSDLLIYDDRHS